MGIYLERIKNINMSNKLSAENITKEINWETIVSTANAATNGYLGLAVLTVVTIVLIEALMKKDYFNKSFLKIAVIVFSIDFIFGIYLIFAGYLQNFGHWLWFVFLFLVQGIILLMKKLKN